MHAYMTSDSDDHVQREKRLQLVKMKEKKNRQDFKTRSGD